jgi:hypothetical protein
MPTPIRSRKATCGQARDAGGEKSISSGAAMTAAAEHGGYACIGGIDKGRSRHCRVVGVADQETFTNARAFDAVCFRVQDDRQRSDRENGFDRERQQRRASLVGVGAVAGGLRALRCGMPTKRQRNVLELSFHGMIIRRSRTWALAGVR